ncbi:MAG: glycerate kinase, partial [Chloroflexi bacterium]|nr:glycerate kinase [Chloroflexota bacterium]
GQSFDGKGTSVLAQLGRKAGVPVIAVVGQVGAGLPDMQAAGIVAVETLVAHAASPEDALQRARALVVEATAAAVGKYLKAATPRL